MADPLEVAENLKRKYREAKALRHEVASSGVVSLFEYREIDKHIKKLEDRIVQFIKTAKGQGVFDD